MKTAVIYARYSSDAQSEQSIEGQLRECRKYADEHDLLVVDTYIDRAMTGTNDNRPDFQRMIRDSAKRQWEVVIVYKLDRFSRNKFESTIHKKTLKDNSVKLVSAMENIPDTPEGIILESLLEGMNQYYSAELAQKVNRGIRESWLKGNSTGGKGYFGYNVVDKKYIIEDREAEIVREIFDRYSKGYTVRAMAADLKERGIRRKDGKYLDAKCLYNILHNVRYTGIVEHYGIVYDKIFPAIISKDVWDKVNEINEGNKQAPGRKKEIYDYILSGKLFCGYCGRRMVGVSGTSRNGSVHYYYACRSLHRRQEGCEQKTVIKQQLEDIVIDAVTRLLSSEENIKLIAHKVCELHKRQTRDNVRLKALQTQRANAEKACNNLIRAIEMGIITEQTKIRLTELERKISELDFDIEKEKQKTYTYLEEKHIENYLLSKVFKDSDDIAVRKLIVNTFIREVRLFNDKIIITFNFTDRGSSRTSPRDCDNLKDMDDISIAEHSVVKSDKIPVDTLFIGSSKNLTGAPTTGASRFSCRPCRLCNECRTA